MRVTLERHRELWSNIAVATVFLAAGSSIGFERPYAYSIFDSPTWPFRLAKIVAAISPLTFLCGAVLAFLRARIGYSLGLAASSLALPWFVLNEAARERDSISAWTVFNSALGRYSTFSVLLIVSVGLIVASGVCAALRLLPTGLLLRQSVWPGFAAAFLVLALWLFHAGTPYRYPLIADGVAPRFRILHVEKQGLHFRETSISAFRDGRVYISRADRTLFQYAFKIRRSVGVAPYEEVEEFRTSPELSGLHTPPVTSLHSWNAEGWYVVREYSPVMVFTSEYKTAPPPTVLETFAKLEDLPAVVEKTETERDVCLGFCYGPLAALGFKYVNSRLP